MRARYKVLIGLAVVLAALLALNAIALNQQTKAADVTVEGGEILSLPGGDVQVLETPAPAGATGAPIVLLHCYLCSLEWWDELAPILAENHRVIRVDLLGHGGSEKPASGYSIPDQAGLVAGALNQLEVQGAVVVGQSMGATVAVALAEQSSQLVDRVVAMNEAPTNEDSELPVLARLGYLPVLGQAMYRLAPDFAIRGGFKKAFAPDFEPSGDFEDDVIVPGYRAVTYTSYKEAYEALGDYRDSEPLDSRITAAAVPLLVVLGSADQVVDTPAAEEDWGTVPGVEIEVLDGVGNAPQVEAPEELAELIVRFAAEAVPPASKESVRGGKDARKRSPRGAAKGNEGKRPKARRARKG
ncbi:MAG: alpha/beta fold hydrolase [Solirubrobacterales bacterium]